MIKRSILRQSQILHSRPNFNPVSLLSRHFPPPFRTPLPISAPKRYLRCYSTTDSNKSVPPTTAQTEGEGGEEEETSPAVEEYESRIKDLESKLDAKSKEATNFKDRYLLSVADFRNLQETTKREVANAKSFALAPFAKDLIESVDNIDRALAVAATSASSLAATEDGEDEAYKAFRVLYDGLTMTEKIQMQTLKKYGIERFDPSEWGDRFDPTFHEATFQTPVEGREDGTVFDTQQKGFTLNGRAAKVGVVKNS